MWGTCGDVLRTRPESLPDPVTHDTHAARLETLTHTHGRHTALCVPPDKWHVPPSPAHNIHNTFIHTHLDIIYNTHTRGERDYIGIPNRAGGETQNVKKLTKYLLLAI